MKTKHKIQKFLKKTIQSLCKVEIRFVDWAFNATECVSCGEYEVKPREGRCIACGCVASKRSTGMKDSGCYIALLKKQVKFVVPDKPTTGELCEQWTNTVFHSGDLKAYLAQNKEHWDKAIEKLKKYENGT